MNKTFKIENLDIFLDELNKITRIDIRILENLYKLNFLNTIFESNSIFILKESIGFFNPKLKDNFKNQLEFVFAQYPLFDNDFKYIVSTPFDPSFKNKIINQKNHSFISCENGYIFLSMLIDYDFFSNQYYTTFDENYKRIFEKYINDIIYSSFDFSVFYSYSLNRFYSKVDHYLFIQCLKTNQIIDTYIEEKSIKYRTFCENIKNDNQKSIDSLLEKLLLQKEMDTF